MDNLFLIINSGHEYDYPRQYLFLSEIKPSTNTTHIGLQIRIRNDVNITDKRILYFYYIDDTNDFIQMIREECRENYNCDKNKNQIMYDLNSSKGVWVDDGENDENGDFYKLFQYNEIANNLHYVNDNTDDDFNHIHREIIINIMTNLSCRIRSSDEENFISEKDICEIIEKQLICGNCEFKIYCEGMIEK